MTSKTGEVSILSDGDMCAIPVPFDPKAVVGKVRVPVKVTVKVSVSIDVPSLEDGIRFYGQAFGFAESSRPHERYAVLTSGDARIGLLAKPAGSSPAQDSEDVRRYDRHWTPVHIDITVEDFESTLEKALDAGAKCEQLHKTAGYPPVAFCSDPFGHGFCIIGRRD